MKLLALTGPAGVGKSTIAAALEARYGFRRVRFAAPLKDMLRAFYRAQLLTEDRIEDRLEGHLKEVPDPLLGGTTPRCAMQTLGSEWGRGLVHADLWVRAWERMARAALEAGPVVVEDCRFANEANAVGRLGGWVVELRRVGVGWSGGHDSEAGLALADCAICNDGTPEAVARRIMAEVH